MNKQTENVKKYDFEYVLCDSEEKWLSRIKLAVIDVW